MIYALKSHGIKLEIISINIAGKLQNICRLNKLINNTWIKKVSREIKQYFELNENTSFQSL